MSLRNAMGHSGILAASIASEIVEAACSEIPRETVSKIIRAKKMAQELVEDLIEAERLGWLAVDAQMAGERSSGKEP